MPDSDVATTEPEESALLHFRRKLQLWITELKCLEALQEQNLEPEAHWHALEAHLALYPESQYAPQLLTKLSPLLATREQKAAVLAMLHQMQAARGDRPKLPEELLLEAEVLALSGELETAKRLLKRALWCTPDDQHAQEKREKVAALQRLYNLG